MNRNKKRIGCGGVIGIFLLVCVVIAMFSKGGSSTKSASTAPKQTKPAAETIAPKGTSTPKPTEQATVEPTVEPTEEAKQVLAVGDTATIGVLEFTVKRVVFSYYPGNLQGYGSIDNDYRYCVVYLDVYNPTNDTVKIRTDIFKGITALTDYYTNLLFDNEVSYNSSFVEYTEFLHGNEEILPRATLTDKVVSFKVPVSVANSTEPLEYSMHYKNEIETTWVLR